MTLLPGLSTTFVARVVGMGLAVGVNIALARLLTPSEAGIVLVTLSVTVILARIFQFGVDRTAVQDLNWAGATPETVIRVRTDATLAVLMSTCVIGLVVLTPAGGQLLGALGLSSTNIWMRIAIVGLAATRAIVLLFSSFHRSSHHHAAAAITTNITSGVLSICGLFALSWARGEPSATATVLVLALAWWPDLFYGAATLFRRAGGSIFSRSMSSAVKSSWGMYRRSWLILCVTISAYVVAQGDLLIVARYVSDEDAALYGTALRIVTIIGIPLVTVASTLGPRIASRLALGELKELEAEIRKTTRIAVFMSVAALLVFVLFGQRLLSLMFGQFYSDSYIIVLVLSVGQLANVAAGPCALILAMAGNDRRQLWLLVLNSAVLLAATFALRPWQFGLPAVAAMFSFGLISQNVLIAREVWRQLGIRSYFPVRETLQSLVRRGH